MLTLPIRFFSRDFLFWNHMKATHGKKNPIAFELAWDEYEAELTEEQTAPLTERAKELLDKRVAFCMSAEHFMQLGHLMHMANATNEHLPIPKADTAVREMSIEVRNTYLRTAFDFLFDTVHGSVFVKDEDKKHAWELGRIALYRFLYPQQRHRAAWIAFPEEDHRPRRVMPLIQDVATLHEEYRQTRINRRFGKDAPQINPFTNKEDIVLPAGRKVEIPLDWSAGQIPLLTAEEQESHLVKELRERKASKEVQQAKDEERMALDKVMDLIKWLLDTQPAFPYGSFGILTSDVKQYMKSSNGGSYGMRFDALKNIRESVHKHLIRISKEEWRKETFIVGLCSVCGKKTEDAEALVGNFFNARQHYEEEFAKARAALEETQEKVKEVESTIEEFRLMLYADTVIERRFSLATSNYHQPLRVRTHQVAADLHDLEKRGGSGDIAFRGYFKNVMKILRGEKEPCGPIVFFNGHAAEQESKLWRKVCEVSRLLREENKA